MSGLTLVNPTQSPEEPDDSPTGAALLDQVTQLIMQGRQTRTLRLPPDE